MASFDIIEAASDGYKTVWKEKHYLVALASIPFLIKLVCFAALSLLGWEQAYLRQALVMLPSFFADGWFLSHLVRLIFLDQRWPFRPTGDESKDLAILDDRTRGIMSGALMFVIIKYLTAGLTAAVYYHMGQDGQIDPQAETSLPMFLLALTSLVFFFWAFRLLWLYIPLAVNVSARWFLAKLGGYAASWSLIGVWLLCFIPTFAIFGKVIGGLITIQNQGGGGVGIAFSIIVLHAALDTLISTFMTAGMACGFKDYVIASPKKSKK